jgi:hypothetical protein
MKLMRDLLLGILLFGNLSSVLAAQPILVPLDSPQAQIAESRFNNPRVVRQSADGTEVTLAIDYAYDGIAGPTAIIIPVIEKRGQKGIGAWFGADHVTLGRGRGIISFRIKYFNDEAGVPPQFTSDRINFLIVAPGGRVVTRDFVLKTIHWGTLNAKPAPVKPASPTPIRTASVKPGQQQASAAAQKTQDDTGIQQREEERLKAADAQRLAEEKRQTEAKAQAEAEAREHARLRAEAQAQQSAEQKRLAEETAKAETAEPEKARLQAEAEEKARLEAEAKAKVQAERVRPNSVETLLPAGNLKTKVTNVDVVNRSTDRSKMTIGVEFDYRDNLRKPMLGVDLVRTGDPQASRYFDVSPAEIGRSRRSFVLLPVTFQPPATQADAFSSYSTDKLQVYLADAGAGQRFPLFTATMLLVWHPPGAKAAEPESASASASLELDDLKQNDLYSGYVTVRYNLPGRPGRLRLRLYNAANPASANYFETTDPKVQAGRNLQLLEFSVKPGVKTPSDLFEVDTVQVELLGDNGVTVANFSKHVPMSFAKPKK